MPDQSYYAQQLEEMKAAGAVRVFPLVQSEQGPHFTVDGKTYLNLCSNNYLGFAAHPRLKKAAVDAIEKYGVGTTSVRSLIGTNVLHVELEKALAHFKKCEDAVVVTSGYLANLAAIQTLLTREDIVISDELNHASIIDGVSLAKIQNKLIYPHNDVAALRAMAPQIRQLQAKKRSDGKDPVTMIVTDGVFSMDGDVANIPELLAVAEELDALLVVDDAHGEGVLGDYGRGVVDHYGIHAHPRIIEVGTLSKAFGVNGGFIAGQHGMVEFLRQKSRQFLFTNALSIPDTAALIESVKILEESDELVKKLWENTRILKEGLKAAGFDTGVSTSPITPVMVGDEAKAREFAAALKAAPVGVGGTAELAGIITTPIVFPMVAKGKARLRLIPSAGHTKEDMEGAVSVIIEVGKRLAALR